jgi:immune inhibitor A
VPGSSTPDAVLAARELGLLSAAADPTRALPDLEGESATPGTQRLTEGPWRIPVLLVDFPGQAADYAPPLFESLLFDTLAANRYGSFTEYYRTVSSGILRPTGRVHGWYTMPKTRAYYANSSFGLNPISGLTSAAGLTQDAVLAADADVNFSQYDRDGDGEVDVVFIVHAGLGGEAAASDPSQLWSVSSTLSAGWNGVHAYVTNDLRAGSTTQFVRVNRFCILPERSALRPDSLATIGVYCHEFGHALGWPDLYDASVLGGGQNLGPGDWCIMATGAYGGDDRSPDRPTRPGAWALVDAGWARVENLSASGTTRFHPADEANVIYRLWWQGEPSAEHFLIENRRRRGIDATLPGEGLIVTRVEADIVASRRGSNRVNSGAIPGVRIEEADGRYDLLYGSTRGDAGDPFPGSSNTRRMADDTQPTSRSYSGRHTNLALESIREDGDDLLAWVQLSPTGWSEPERHPLASRLRLSSGRAAARVGPHLYLIGHDEADSNRVRAVRHAYGVTWGGEETVAFGGATTDAAWSEPQSGPLVALWSERQGGPPEIHYRRWGDPRGSERRATFSPGFATRPAAAWIAAGRLALVWLDSRSGRSQVYFKAFRPGEEESAIEAAVSVEAQTPDVLELVLAAGPHGRLQIAYTARGPFGDELFWQQFHPDSGWSLPRFLSPQDGAPSGSVDLHVATDGTIRAAWRDAGISRAQVQVVRFDPEASELYFFPQPVFHSALSLSDLRFASGPVAGTTILVGRASDPSFDRILVGGDHGDGAWDVGFGWLGPSYEAGGSEVLVDIDPDGIPTLLWTTNTATGSLVWTTSRGARPTVPVSSPITVAPAPAVRAEPNPARSLVRFQASGLGPGATIALYASSGRCVARLDAGTGEAWWRGADGDGGIAPAGVYFVRVEDERGAPIGAARKLVWLR